MRQAGGAALWAVAGALVALGLIGAASIGMFILPFGLAGVVLLAVRETPGAWGAAIGVGLLLVGVGLAEAMDGIPSCTSRGVSDPPSPGVPSRCEEGGIAPAIFLALGGLGLLGGIVAAVGERPRPD